MTRTPDQQRALDRREVWRTRYAEKLAGFHPDLRAEIESTVRERFLAGNYSPLTDEDQHYCLTRVAGRKRVHTGNIPAGEAGSGAQLLAVVAEIEAWRRVA